MHAAKKLCAALQPDDVVYLISGFVLHPYKKAETDGIISTMLLARCLIRAFGARPVVICPDECMGAVEGLASILGVHLTDVAALFSIPFTMSAVSFSKDAAAAERLSDAIIEATGMPKAVISIEAPGANREGKYHNAVGRDVTELEAKSDILWEKLCDAGVLNIAIGDLGNEIGMGAISEHRKIHTLCREGCLCMRMRYRHTCKDQDGQSCDGHCLRLGMLRCDGRYCIFERGPRLVPRCSFSKACHGKGCGMRCDRYVRLGDPCY